MNSDQPPLAFPDPRVEPRRQDNIPIMLPKARVDARAETARVLGNMAATIDTQLAGLDEQQRHQAIIKVEHERPVDLGGTGLKLLGSQGEHVSLAVLKQDEQDLRRFRQKLQEFGTGPLQRGNQPKHKQLDGIHAIKRGEPTDRLSDALFDKYKSLIASDEHVTVEIEITSLHQGINQRRNELASIRTELQQAFGLGVHGYFFEHEEDEGSNVCRAVIQCSGPMLRRLVEDSAWIRKITWFDGRPNFKTFQETVEEFNVENLGEIIPPPENAPIVCVIDSGVTPQNPLLQPVVRQDLLKSFLKSAPNDPYDGFGHGSAVASLAAYNAINIAEGAENRAKVWIASARIVTADNELEDEKLFSVLLKEVVEYFKPLGVRIFNLSLGNEDLKWNQTSRRTADRKSWVARKIDSLSREHDVVFVTCTGNLLCPDINQGYISRGVHYPSYLAEEGAEILDPGQAALALTTGSIAPGTTVANNSSDTAVAAVHQPSPFTRCGPGIRREMKPELVDYGGNYAKGPDGRLRPARGLHVVVASHQQSPAIAYDCGTSLAAPRVAHKLGLAMSDLKQFGIHNPSSALLKAFLVNSATYRAGKKGHKEFTETMDGHKKGHWFNVLGYGQPDETRATDCDDYSCIFFYEGSIERNKVAFFSVPVPGELADAGRKRLTVTVCSTPEVQKNGLMTYLGTATMWRMFRGDVSHEDVIAAMGEESEPDGDEEDDQSEQPENGPTPKELKFAPGIKRRSRGVVQHGVFEWIQHLPEYSDHGYTLAVGSYEKWGRREGQAPPLPYAVVVRLEDLGRTVNIYEKIRLTLSPLKT